MTDPFKLCRGCGETKPASGFHISRAMPSGLVHRCKVCSLIRHKAYYLANKAAAKARAKKWAALNPERRKEIARAWERRNLDAMLAKSRAWWKRKKAEDPAYVRRLWRNSTRAWNAANKERLAVIAKRSRDARKRRDPEGYALVCREMAALRRARKKQNGFEKVDFSAVIARDGMTCHLCRLPVSDADLEFDHVIPISKGGPHTFANLAVSHARCNRSKGAKILVAA